MIEAKKTIRKTGLRGGALHQELMGWLRFDFLPSLEELFPEIEWFVLFDDGLMATLLETQGHAYKPNGGKKGGYYPDGLVVYNDNESGETGSLAIEVGRYDPSRAPEVVTVLHVGFNGRVSLINTPPGELWDIPLAVMEILRISPQVVGLGIDDTDTAVDYVRY